MASKLSLLDQGESTSDAGLPDGEARLCLPCTLTGRDHQYPLSQ
jgi:hypothetical protein